MRKKSKSVTRSLFASAACLAVVGCSQSAQWAAGEASGAGADGDVTVIRIDPTNVTAYAAPPELDARPTVPDIGSWDYRVGSGDILSIHVFDHPQLALPAPVNGSASASGDDRRGGVQIREDGTFFYPFVGQVAAAGRQPEEIRLELTQRLSEFITDPQVELRVVGFHSQSVNVTGGQSGGTRLPITTVRTRLVDAINAAGGLPEGADASRITLNRRGVSYRVDLMSFLEDGDRSGNPTLIGGDVVHIPEQRPREVFVLGEVAMPSSIDLARENLSVTQALARQGGLERIRADASGVFIFRDVNDQPTVFQLDLSSPRGFLLGNEFALVPGDVVYVTTAPLQVWNDTLSQIIPTVNATSSVRNAVDG